MEILPVSGTVFLGRSPLVPYGQIFVEAKKSDATWTFFFNSGLCCSVEYCHLPRNLKIISVKVKFSCGGSYPSGVSSMVGSEILMTVVIVIQLESLNILGFYYSLNVFCCFPCFQSCSIAIRKGCPIS